MIDFKNKKILITGATGGIGGDIVKKFISLGGSVLATGTKLEKLELIKKIIEMLKLKSLIYHNTPLLKNLLIHLLLN